MLKETVSWCKPTKATKYSACVDLYAKEDIIIGAGCTSIVNLGVKIDWKEIMKICASCDPFVSADDDIKEYEKFMKSHYLELHPRSSLRANGLTIGVGVIDLDFTDEIGLIVHNPHQYIENEYLISLDATTQSGLPIPQPIKEDYIIIKGDKIAQCTLKEHKGWMLGIESDTERSGGFGSTGGIR